MRISFLTFMFLALAGCANVKRAAEKNDDHICEKIKLWTPELKHMSKSWVNNDSIAEVDAYTLDTIGLVKCLETATCEQENYCITYRNARLEITNFFNPIHHEDPKCEKFMKLPEYARNLLPAPPKDSLFSVDAQDYCVCDEVIACDYYYCNSYLCPDGTSISRLH